MSGIISTQPKLLAYVTLVLGISACTIPQVPPSVVYTHPSYGEVILPNDIYAQDREDCKHAVYAGGVLVDGIRETDPALIDAYLADVHDWYFKEVQAIRSTKRAAAVGYATGMRGGGIYVPVMLPSDYGLENPAIPEKYHDVIRANLDIERCVGSKGWQRVDL